MSDPNDPRSVPGMGAPMDGFSTAQKSMQSFASEVQRMSKDSLDHTTRAMEKLRGAKTMEEVVSIQTGFMQQSFANYADFTRRYSELMMALPMELAKQSRSAFQQGTDALKKVAEQTGEQIQKAGEPFNHG